jgi:hypothetical protein
MKNSIETTFGVIVTPNKYLLLKSTTAEHAKNNEWGIHTITRQTRIELMHYSLDDAKYNLMCIAESITENNNKYEIGLYGKYKCIYDTQSEAKTKKGLAIYMQGWTTLKIGIWDYKIVSLEEFIERFGESELMILVDKFPTEFNLNI